MFGYVKPDTPYLYMKDDVLYKALYCGACKSIGCACGAAARFTLTYDIAFLSAITHNLLGIDVKIERKHCIAHPFTKRPIAKPDDLSLVLGSLNVILAYFKLSDDVADNGRGRFKRLLVNRGFKRAAKACPKLCEIVKVEYEKLSSLEKGGETRIDVISDPFASMLERLSGELLGDKATEYTKLFFYNLGKWIYVIDALDDYDEDIKKGNYNAFFAAYKAENFEKLKQNAAEDVNFILSAIISCIDEAISKLEFKFNADLIRNVASRGVKARTKAVLNKPQNNKKSKKNEYDAY